MRTGSVYRRRQVASIASASLVAGMVVGFAGGRAEAQAPLRPAPATSGATTTPGAPPDRGRARPRIGLVLGGGGARGTAHVGVLQILEELRVPVDLVVGTSMGALVGGLYAAGISPDSMEAWLRRADWDELFRDGPPFRELSYRRKEDIRAFPMPLVTGLGRRGIQLPQGLIAGQKVTGVLRSMTLGAALVADFDSLAVPFRAVATDLESGEAKVFAGGDLVDAVRASMSVPGLFAPFPVDRRLYVDGGLVDNLPIHVARELGADVIIAVDVGSRLQDRTAIEGLLDVTTQVTRIVTRSSSARDLALLASHDVLIAPSLGDASSTDFDRSLEIVAAGRAAGLGAAGVLKGLALDPASYAEHTAARAEFGAPPDRVDFVVVGEYSGRSPGNLLDRLATRPGPLDTTVVARDVDFLYGLGIYDHVDYLLTDTPAGVELVFRLREKSWGPWYLRYRLSISDAVGREGAYSVATQLLIPQVNDMGAEVVTGVEIGARRRFTTEFYQPLGLRSLFFVSPWFSHASTPVDIVEAGRAAARLRTTFTAAGLRAGIHPGSRAELAVGVERGIVRVEPAIGTGSLESTETRTGAARFGFGYNTLDDPQFPGAGIAAGLDVQGAREWLGSQAVYDRADLVLLAATTRGRNSLFGFILASSGLGSELPPFARPALGGFLLLSGYRAGEISGQHVAFGRLIAARELIPDGVRVALSLEAGQAWEHRSDVDLARLRGSAALILGLPTILGPVYVGLGGRGSGGPAFYLEVGRTL